MYTFFSKQHILNFPGKMGCSILCACVGEKTFVHLQAVVGKYCQDSLKIEIALHPTPPQHFTLPTPEKWKSLLCVGTPGVIVFHLSPCQLNSFNLLCACSPGVIPGMCEQQPFSAWLGSQLWPSRAKGTTERHHQGHPHMLENDFECPEVWGFEKG